MEEVVKAKVEKVRLFDNEEPVKKEHKEEEDQHLAVNIMEAIDS